MVDCTETTGIMLSGIGSQLKQFLNSVKGDHSEVSIRHVGGIRENSLLIHSDETCHSSAIVRTRFNKDSGCTEYVTDCVLRQEKLKDVDKALQLAKSSSRTAGTRCLRKRDKTCGSKTTEKTTTTAVIKKSPSAVIKRKNSIAAVLKKKNSIAAVLKNEKNSIAAVLKDEKNSIAAVLKDEKNSIAAVLKDEKNSIAAVLKKKNSIAAVLKNEKNSIAAVLKDEKNSIAAVTKNKENSIAAVLKDEKNSIAAVLKDEKNSIAAVTKNKEKSIAAAHKDEKKSIAAVLKDEKKSVVAVTKNTENSIAAVTKDEKKSIAAVTKNKEKSIAAARKDEKKSVAAVTKNKEKSVAAVTMNKENSIAAVTKDEKKSIAAVTKNEKKSIAAVTKNKENSIAAVTKNEKKSIAAVTKNKEKSIAAVTKNKENSIAAVLKKKKPAAAAIKKEEKKDETEVLSRICVGDYEINTFYFSPFPETSGKDALLTICEFCCKCLRNVKSGGHHCCCCAVQDPPGWEMYCKDDLSIHEVDGKKYVAYCRNLCLLAKLFLQHKIIFVDVELFWFYVLTKRDRLGAHLIGYFSKAKQSPDGFNLSCILTLPPFQQKGYGKLLIDFSYTLSKMKGIVGSPEKPLSIQGERSYRSYWRWVLLEQMGKCSWKMPSIRELMSTTSIAWRDIVDTLRNLNMIKRKNGRFFIRATPEEVGDHLEVVRRKRPHFSVDPECVKWEPVKKKARKGRK